MTTLAVLLALAVPGFPTPAPMPPIVDAACPAFPARSCTAPTLPVYLNPGSSTPAHDLWHEVGHHADYTLLDDGERNRFRQLVGDLRPWRTSPNSPHEQFAEAYAHCVLGHRPPFRRASYTYEPSRRQHRQVCGFIARAGADLEVGR